MKIRNKTVVIKDNKVIVNQYGSFDGNPSKSTLSIVNFLKNEESEDFLKAMKYVRYVDMHYVYGVEDGIPEYFYGTKHTELFERVTNRIRNMRVESNYHITLPKIIDQLMAEFDQQYVADYITLTKDFGYQILEAIATLYKYNVTINVFISTYLGWDIEAINTINLDDATLTLIWHGNEKTWHFNELPNETELRELEEIADR